MSKGVYELILVNGTIVVGWTDDFQLILQQYLCEESNYIWMIRENSQPGKITYIKPELVLYIRIPEKENDNPL